MGIFIAKRGFTLVEIMVASIIGLLVSLVAVGALKAFSASADVVNHSIDTAAEVKFAARLIAADLTNIYHDPNSRDSRFVATAEQSANGITTDLTLYTTGRAKARIDQPEGDVYEVEYYLMQNNDRLVLCRRLNPHPTEDFLRGGVLSVIAENIDVFTIRFFDGQHWQSEWPRQMESLPELAEVMLAARKEGTSEKVIASFIVNLALSRGIAAGAFEENQQAQPQETADAEGQVNREAQ